MPTLSVIVRTYDRPNLLRRALTGILNQTVPADELILVNNGGTPAPSAMLNEILGTKKGALPLLTALDLPEALSLGAAANAGLRLAKGDWVAFHDDDDVWPATYLFETLEVLRELHPDITLLAAPVTEVMETLTGSAEYVETARFGLRPDISPGILPLAKILQSNLLPPIALWYKREALLEVGGYAEDISVLEDWVANRALLLKYPAWLRTGTPAEYHVRTATAGTELPANPEGRNTVTAKLDTHLRTHQLLLDRWLREELASGQFGPAMYALLSEQQQQAIQSLREQSIAWRLIRKIRNRIRRLR